MDEIWRPIQGFDGYFVSDQGNVRAKRFDRNLKPTVRKADGYLVVTLHNGSRKKQFFVHRLVANAFLNAASTQLTVDHRSGDKTDNRLLNLRLVTASDNVRLSYRDGRHPSRSGTGIGAKLSPSDVQEIKARLAKGEIGCHIAKEYGVHEATISCIKVGKSWKR